MIHIYNKTFPVPVSAPILGIAAIAVLVGALWISYPSIVALLQNPGIKFNLAAAGSTGTATLT
jgi:hypothetical protein